MMRGRRDGRSTQWEFQPYDADQLREILENRRDAFKDGVLSNDVIPLVAAFATQEFDTLSERRVQEVLKEQNFLNVTQSVRRASTAARA